MRKNNTFLINPAEELHKFEINGFNTHFDFSGSIWFNVGNKVVYEYSIFQSMVESGCSVSFMLLKHPTESRGALLSINPIKYLYFTS